MYRILLVEDDQVIASTIREQLSGWGYEVTCVEDFSRVMELFAQVEP